MLLVQLQLAAIAILNKALTFVSRFSFNVHYLVGFSEHPRKADGVSVIISTLYVRRWKPR